MWLAVKLDDDLQISEIADAKTEGAAHRKARDFADAGFRARVIPPQDASEVAFFWDQICQKKEMGFIEEYGHVPNGTREQGDGVHKIGHMIYPAFGGILEGASGEVKNLGTPTSAESEVVGITSYHRASPPVLSSKEIPQKNKKLILYLGEHG
jgi:hypothetical protein